MEGSPCEGWVIRNNFSMGRTHVIFADTPKNSFKPTSQNNIFVRISRYHGRFIIVHHHFTGCWFQIFLMFTLKIGEDEPIWTIHVFQLGWFNHQLADNYYVYIFIYIMTCQPPPPDVPPFLATQRLDVGSCEVRAEAAAPVVQVEVGGSNLPPLYRSAKVKVYSLKWYLH